MTSDEWTYTPPPEPTTVVLPDKVEKIRHEMAHLFLVGDTSLDVPHPGYMRYRGRFLVDSAECYDELRAIFEAHGFTPLVRAEDNGRIAVIGKPEVFRAKPSDWRINALLFVTTLFSTLLTGSFYETGTFQIWKGWPFALSIMLILGAHELGHYFAARHHKVPVTLPYFIPLPLLSPIGTMGAVIRMKGPVKNRRALLDIGAAGPLAGLVFAIPILFYGLATSETGPLTNIGIMEGNSIFYAAAKFIVFGQFLPDSARDVYLNQVAWAGWVGLLVTSLNLLPLGQLDGGHVTYTLFGRKAGKLFIPFVAGLAALAIFSFLTYGTLTWGLWVVLLFLVGRVYAEPLDDVTELDAKRRWIAIGTLVIFVLIFMPVPLRVLGV